MTKAEIESTISFYKGLSGIFAILFLLGLFGLIAAPPIIAGAPLPVGGFFWCSYQASRYEKKLQNLK